MKIVRAVFEKNGDNLEKRLKTAKNGHFQWFSGILTPKMNFLKKIDPANVSAVWKYIKNVKDGENPFASIKYAHENTNSRKFRYVSSEHDFRLFMKIL